MFKYMRRECCTSGTKGVPEYQALHFIYYTLNRITTKMVWKVLEYVVLYSYVD